MADVEIVIKLSEKNCEYIKRLGTLWIKSENGLSIVSKVLLEGTILPKGHGKLKDFDQIEWYGCDLEGRGCIEVKGDCSICNHANCYAKQVRELPTIIEADKAESEEV